MTEPAVPSDALIIRYEEPGDVAAIRHLLEQAFGGPDEANLVDAIRQRGAFILSLVAILGNQVVGHILFTPVTIESESLSSDAVGLGPMAVLPGYQHKGIGSQLVRSGLKECRRAGHDIVVVVGHPEYYPRFGFSPARPFRIQLDLEVPEEAFMVLELRKGALAGRAGIVRYLPEFHSA